MHGYVSLRHVAAPEIMHVCMHVCMYVCMCTATMMSVSTEDVCMDVSVCCMLQIYSQICMYAFICVCICVCV